LYGQTVSFSIENFIREVRPFTSFTDLKAQIAADITAVKQCLSG
jgi:FAD synthase